MIGNDIVDLTLAQKESNWRRKGFLNKIFTAHEQQLIRTAVDPDQMVWLLWSMKESAYKIAVRDSGKRSFAPIKLACCLSEWTNKNAEGIVHYEEKEYLTKSSLTAQYIATVSINKKVLPDMKNCCTGFQPVQARCLYDKPAELICLHLANKYILPDWRADFPVRVLRTGSPGDCNFGVLHPQGRPGGEPLLATLSCLHLTLSVHLSWFDNIIVPLDEMAYPLQHTLLWEKIKQYYATALSVTEAEIYFYKDEAGAPWMTLSSEEKVPLSVSHHGRFGAFVISSPQFTVHSPCIYSIV